MVRPGANEDPDPVSAAAVLVHANRQYVVADVRVQALNDVTISVSRNRLTALTGPSGSGKSTLLHCICGLDRLTSGRAYLGGVDLATLDDGALTKLRRRRVGVIFQSYNLLTGFSVDDNLRLPAIVAGMRIDPGWFDEVVARLGLGDRLRHTPAQLSGGQQQRVAAARALLMRPELIIADEPTGNLDTANGRRLLALLRLAVDELGQTVMVATHDPDVAGDADELIRLQDGRAIGANVIAD